MFQEALLESSPVVRKQNRRSMLAAFAAETMVASLLITLPLFSTGMISTSTHPPVFVPIAEAPAELVHQSVQKASSGGAAIRGSASTVVSITNRASVLNPYHVAENFVALAPGPSFPAGTGSNSSTVPALFNTAPAPSVQRLRVSVLSEGMLVHKVQPVYPRAAIPAGIHGEVKLHALIGRDGSVQTLTAISGHPLLVQAAMEAVRQWRYRPYILNGQPMEVETFITVNFRPQN